MIKKLLPVAIVLFGGIFIVASLKNHSLDTSLSQWGDDYQGYAEASELQKTSNQPMAVFFYTDWYSNCKALREQVLASAEVESFMKNVHAVKVNPEAGIDEDLLANKFGVFGYPSFYMVMEGGRVVKQIQRTANISPEQFVAQMQQAIHASSAM